jgi:hypothetical protein
VWRLWSRMEGDEVGLLMERQTLDLWGCCEYGHDSLPSDGHYSLPSVTQSADWKFAASGVTGTSSLEVYAETVMHKKQITCCHVIGKLWGNHENPLERIFTRSKIQEILFTNPLNTFTKKRY